MERVIKILQDMEKYNLGLASELGSELWKDFKAVLREELEQTLSKPIDMFGGGCLINEEKCWKIVKSFRDWLGFE
jgi:hypothetical protein